MHYVEAKGILSANNGMNLYRGCTHGCIYCDSRSKCYKMSHEFEDIEVKTNALELLEQTLKHKRKRCMIGTGAMTDPYIPLEMELQHVRKSLELIRDYGYGIVIQTKSARILHDIDLLQEINQRTKAVVAMTLTTYDEELCKLVEPNVSTTRERYEVLMEMKRAGIPTVVWLSPILPFINDTPENINGIMDLCIDAGARGIICFGMGVTLREGNREYFYEKLEEHFPGMKEQYSKTYGNAYMIDSPRQAELMKIFYRRCEEHGIESDVNKNFTYVRTFEEKGAGEQLTLF